MKLLIYLGSITIISISSFSCAPSENPTATDSRASQAKTETTAFPKVISSGWTAQNDGKPSEGLNGFSYMSYARKGAPADVVDVYYHGSDGRRINTDEPEFVQIMGQKIQTYGSGNEEAAFATQRFLLTPPSAAYYSFEFHGDHLYKSRKIPEFGW
jgi:hypothetical protein